MKRLSVIVTILVFVLTFTGCTKVNQQNTDQTMQPETEKEDVIKIGYTGPLTGDSASFGEDEKSAIELFLETKGYMADDKKIEVIYEDTQCSGQVATNAVTKLIEVDKVKFILGDFCSGATLSIAPIAERNQVLQITSGSSNPTIKDAGDYIFRNWPSDAIAGKQTVEDMVAEGYTKIAMITENTDFAQGFRGAMVETAENMNIEFVIDEAFNPDTTDFKTVITKIAGSDADVFMSNVQDPAIHGLIFKQAQELGLELPKYANNSVNGKEFFDQAKDATEGVAFFDVALDESRPLTKDFIERATAKGINNFTFAATKYDATQLVYEGIEQFGNDPNKVKQWLYDLPEFEGVAGTYSFDEYGEVNLPLVKKVATDGEFVVAEE